MIDNIVRNARIKYQSIPPNRRRILIAIVLGFLFYFWTITSFSGRENLEVNSNSSHHPSDKRDEAVDKLPPVKANINDKGKTSKSRGEALIVVSGFEESTLSDGLKQAYSIYSKRSGDVSVVISASNRIVEEVTSKLDISQKDIIIDDQSTTVADNALFVAKLAKEKNSEELVVIAYDYAMLRTQYVFNTIIPSDISIDFVNTETPAKERSANWNSEYVRFADAEKELKEKGIINEKESYGYHPIRNLPRWMMIARELDGDLKENPDLLKKPAEEMTMVDYGSNYGYFSVHLAQKFPNGKMVSLEGEATTEYKSAATVHKEKLQELGVNNNYICRTRTQPHAFTALKNSHQVYAYQLCLSVFHWFNMPTKESFEEALYNHLMNSRTTFIELPEARKYDGREGQHAWDWVNKWYNGRTEVQIINDLAKKYLWGRYEVKVLGAISHDNRTVRKMLRVDLLDNHPSADVNVVLKTYGCNKDNTYVGEGDVSA
eukprot:TRINITY_DN2205_c0_g1_i1.p1 TRINITY_DN2205_c0_g1~~TRINITY_DN2205_c0_g1_i1.p1  ORF type:complete len:489 (-),score=152.84 TRINITY_DN2205_c0_g1_i1:67-1533(-)